MKLCNSGVLERLSMVNLDVKHLEEPHWPRREARIGRPDAPARALANKPCGPRRRLQCERKHKQQQNRQRLNKTNSTHSTPPINARWFQQSTYKERTAEAMALFNNQQRLAKTCPTQIQTPFSLFNGKTGQKNYLLFAISDNQKLWCSRGSQTRGTLPSFWLNKTIPLRKENKVRLLWVNK